MFLERSLIGKELHVRTAHIIDLFGDYFLNLIGGPNLFFLFSPSVALIVPSLSVAARRLHDINKSGWWQLLWITLIGGILLIIWHATEGENKKNKFGPPINCKK